MTLNDIVATAAGTVAGPRDSLTAFAVWELASVYDPKAIDSENLALAVGALQRASERLAEMAHAVSDLARLEERAA